VTVDPAASAAERVLAGLDPERVEAVRALSGPVCILAGAGTGKTRAITHRIAYAVHTGAAPAGRILAVTFTTRAAGEMRTRLRSLAVAGVQTRTFHAAALRQLRHFAPRVLGGPMPELAENKLRLVASAATRCRVQADRTMLRAIEEHGDVADEVRARYRHFVVDEYQDVSPLQQRVLDAWLGRPARRVRRGGCEPDHLLLRRRRTGVSHRLRPGASRHDGRAAGTRLPLDPAGCRPRERHRRRQRPADIHPAATRQSTRGRPGPDLLPSTTTNRPRPPPSPPARSGSSVPDQKRCRRRSGPGRPSGSQIAR